MRANALLALLFASLLQTGPAACGGSVCGNGKVESGEQCDDGNMRDDDACTNSCMQHDTLDAQVKWTLLGQEAPGFSETCGGVGASKIHLVIAGPMPFDQTVDCSSSQYIFKALTPGDYTVTGTLLDIMDMPVTKGMSTTGFTISGADVNVTLNFGFDDFVSSYFGNYFYRIKWGGAVTCADGVPPVVMTKFRLERGGQPIKNMDGTITVDGVTPTPCHDFTEQFAESVNTLPWGPATAIITGLDGNGVPQFKGTFPTFVGAGVSNPIIEFDVNSLAPDAGPADAAAVDAVPADI